MWQKIIPEKALSCPYLLHGIFATSALHLVLSDSCQNQERASLIEAAESNQSESIKMFTRQVNQMGPFERDASFPLSCLLIGSAFAFPLSVNSTTEDRSQLSALDDLIEIFILVRKMNTFTAPMINDVRNSELGGLLLVEQSQSNLSESTGLAMEALHNLVRVMCSSTQRDCKVFIDTIGCLKSLLSKLNGEVEGVSGMYRWIYEVPGEFIDCLSEQNNLGLIILAHYCVVLHWLRRHWWISSWGKRVLDAILRVLPRSLKPYLAWALEEINSCP